MTIATLRFVGGVDDFLITHAAAWLDNGDSTGISEHVEAIAEREERVARGDRAGESQSGMFGFDLGDARESRRLI